MKRIIKYIDRKILFNILTTIYKKYLFRKTKKFLNSYPNFSIFFKSNEINPLIDLYDKYGSDKGSVGKNSHFYSSFYDEVFKKKKEEIKLILECGIGTADTNLHSNMGVNARPGASLKVYRDYFINAQIHGADIDKNILFSSDRISTHYVDQLNILSINEMWKSIGFDNFDLIIDDGMHSLDANYNFFINSFSKLKKNGIYIIEDVHTAYMTDLVKKLNKYKPQIIALTAKPNIDDYLLVIKKF
tara:strand:+ start:48 stop:779 length:732 start_codon:yes stop_codon:yes gene_type:complete